MFLNDGTTISTIITNELRECYGIKYRKEKRSNNKQNEKHRSGKIFSIPFDKLELTDVILSNGGITQVPLFVSDACQRILDQVTTEGLFRKAGSAARQREIKASLESGKRLGKNNHAIDVANILKMFFRELPEPIFPPGNIQDTMLRCLLCGDKKINALMLTCLLLPKLSLNTLAFFMQFLNTVSMHSDKNKMTIENLAIIFAPGLMPLNEIIPQRLNSHCKLMQILIERANEIGIVPQYVLDKVNNGNSVQNINTASAAVGGGCMTDTDKKKKKRRSGSLTRMFNGFRKIVGAIGSAESLEKTPEINPVTPCLSTTTKKRKVLDATSFSAKKKKDVLSLLPENGSVLPNTPAQPSTKVPKKCRLSLGGKRNQNTKTIQQQQPPQIMERRWSVVGTAWNRKKPSINNHDADESSLLNNKSNSSYNFLNISQCGSSSPRTPPNNHSKLINTTVNGTDDPDSFCTFSKSEYESIKKRVSQIETRISQEFSNVVASIAAAAAAGTGSTVDNVVNHDDDNNSSRNLINGPENVLNKYEKTLEETELLNCSATSTDQLAKRLSRDLKIRRSAENRIIRSPSARKICTIRRKSRENIRLSRNQSWHLGTSNLNTGVPPLRNNLISTGCGDSVNPKINLKRGRPNTLQTGLRLPSPPKKILSDMNQLKDISNEFPSLTLKITEPCDKLLLSEQWQSADEFFVDCCSVPTTPTPPPPKSLAPKTTPDINNKKTFSSFFHKKNMEINELSSPNTMKTPMLPPSIPVRRTATSAVSSSAQQRQSIKLNLNNKNNLTPIQQQEQQNGRASIARLRCQNAGMVAAKARLFNGYVSEITSTTNENQTTPTTSMNSISHPMVQKQRNSRKCFVKDTDQNKMSIFTNNQNKLKNKYRGVGGGSGIGGASSDIISSPRKSITPRGKRNSNMNGIQRRHKLRMAKSPMNKSPMHLKHLMMVTDISKNKSTNSPRRTTNTNNYHQQQNPPATVVIDEFKSNDNSNKKKHNLNINLDQFTPKIKRPLHVNSPRKLIRSHGRENQRPSPMRATTPMQQQRRCSPRLQQQHQQILLY